MFEQIIKFAGLESEKDFSFLCIDGDILIGIVPTSVMTYELLAICTVEAAPYVVRQETFNEMQAAMRVVVELLKAEYDI